MIDFFGLYFTAYQHLLVLNTSSLLVRFYVLLVAIVLVRPYLQDGLFLDGVNYANVANNLANEKGAFLALYVLVDLLASVPFVVMLEQRRFYLLTAICYFATSIPVALQKHYSP